jgi:hypothetical protein
LERRPARAQLDRLFQRRADALEKEKWKIQFGDHEVGVQDMVSSAFEKVLMVKDLIDTAASASPPAALACAGLSVVFTLVLQATGNQAILLQTLEYTSDLIVATKSWKMFTDRMRTPPSRQETKPICSGGSRTI